MFADFTAGLQPVFFRHHHVEQNDVGQKLAGLFHGLLPIDGFEDLVMRAQLRFQKTQHVRFIVRNEDGRQLAVS